MGLIFQVVAFAVYQAQHSWCAARLGYEGIVGGKTPFISAFFQLPIDGVMINFLSSYFPFYFLLDRDFS